MHTLALTAYALALWVGAGLAIAALWSGARRNPYGARYLAAYACGGFGLALALAAGQASAGARAPLALAACGAVAAMVALQCAAQRYAQARANARPGYVRPRR